MDRDGRRPGPPPGWDRGRAPAGGAFGPAVRRKALDDMPGPPWGREGPPPQRGGPPPRGGPAPFDRRGPPPPQGPPDRRFGPGPDRGWGHHGGAPPPFGSPSDWDDPRDGPPRGPPPQGGGPFRHGPPGGGPLPGGVTGPPWRGNGPRGGPPPGGMGPASAGWRGGDRGRPRSPSGSPPPSARSRGCLPPPPMHGSNAGAMMPGPPRGRSRSRSPPRNDRGRGEMMGGGPPGGQAPQGGHQVPPHRMSLLRSMPGGGGARRNMMGQPPQGHGARLPVRGRSPSPSPSGIRRSREEHREAGELTPEDDEEPGSQRDVGRGHHASASLRGDQVAAGGRSPPPPAGWDASPPRSSRGAGGGDQEGTVPRGRVRGREPQGMDLDDRSPPQLHLPARVTAHAGGRHPRDDADPSAPLPPPPHRPDATAAAAVVEPEPKRRKVAWGQGLARLNSGDAEVITSPGANNVGAAADVAVPPPPPPRGAASHADRQPQGAGTRGMPASVPAGALLAAFTARSTTTQVQTQHEPGRGHPLRGRHEGYVAPPMGSPPPPPPVAAAHRSGRPSLLHGTAAGGDAAGAETAMASAAAQVASPPMARQVSKADVLADIDRVDAEITALERRLAAIRQLEEEDDVDACERAAIKAAAALGGMQKPTKPVMLRLPAPPKIRTAFDDTPAAVVLAAVRREEISSRSQPALDATVVQLLAANQGRREAAEATIGLGIGAAAAVMRSTPRPQGAPFEAAIEAVLARNAAQHACLRPAVSAVLVSRSSALQQRHVHLALEYRMRQARWLAGLAEQQRSSGQQQQAAQARSNFASPRGGSRSGAVGDGGVVRSAYEEELLMQRLARQERLKTLIAVPPSQILDAHDLRWRTLGSNTNARVLDPVQALADEARRRPWSADERRTFLEKFSQYGKQFSRIAAHLPLRSTADCVVWYYRHQKTDAGFTGKRKTQLKRRRQYAELKRTYGSGGGGVAYERGGGAAAAAYPGDGAAPVAAGPPRSRAGATAEARQEKAALAAAAKAAGKPVGLAARRLERQAAALAEAEALFNEADTEALVAAVRVHGKSFKAIATATGFSAAQVKMFWTAHRLSKDLDTLATQAQAAAVAAAERAHVQHIVPVADPAAAAMASAALLSAFPGGLPPLLPQPALLAMASGATGGQQGDQQQQQQQAGAGDSNVMMRAMMMQQAGIALAAQAFGGAFSGLGAGENANAGGDGMQPSAEAANRAAPHPVLRCVAFIQTHTKDDDDDRGAAEEGGLHEEAQDGAANVAVAEQQEGQHPHGGAGGGEAQDAAQDMVIDALPAEAEEAPDGGEALKSGGYAQD